jgi:hypothetical protein
MILEHNRHTIFFFVADPLEALRLSLALKEFPETKTYADLENYVLKEPA